MDGSSVSSDNENQGELYKKKQTNLPFLRKPHQLHERHIFDYSPGCVELMFDRIKKGQTLLLVSFSQLNAILKPELCWAAACSICMLLQQLPEEQGFI